MTKKLEDYFKEFEDKVVGIEEIIEGEYGRIRAFDSTKHSIFKNFSLVKGFIKAQYNLENQRDLWHTAIDLLNASKAFNSEIKEEVRERLLVYCFAELENLNNAILQLQTQKTTTVEGNAEKANKPDTTVEGNSEKFEESEKKGTGKKGTGKKGTGKVKPFNWQGTQAQLVFLIEQLIEHKFLSPISQTEKHRLTAQHFTVEGKSLNPKNLARTRYNSLDTKKGKPERGEEIEQIISAVKKQNP